MKRKPKRCESGDHLYVSDGDATFTQIRDAVRRDVGERYLFTEGEMNRINEALSVLLAVFISKRPIKKRKDKKR